VQPPLPLPAVHPEVTAAKAFKPVIVIDPGHGGFDSGAVKNGAIEKDVVLAFSKVLKQKIEAAGRFRVVLTRDKDVFVELGERVAFAERNKASLFIAVHADYATTQARGATIYSLRETVASALQRSAKDDAYDNVLSKDEVDKVKKASVDGDLSAVKKILADLAGRELDVTRERTSLFTRSVVEYMGTSTGMRHDPDQQASFRVLKTAQFPSVLIELAYVTNKEDAELLKSDKWRDKVADSIMVAVENYFSHQIARLPM
jgi:N-acetylmuramoyl-L-alanine amidase